MQFYPKLQETIALAQALSIPEERKEAIAPLLSYAEQQLIQGKVPKLNFICTHNSRRSQLSQIWARTAATYYSVPMETYSGGVEVTEFNPRAVATLKLQGFQMASFGKENPKYKVKFAGGDELIIAFSKLYDDAANPSEAFAAVMTCADADENCPYIPGAEVRIPLRYEDPKAFDSTPLESEKYQERSLQIASEMFYLAKALHDFGK
ncbi:low molecular weight phosphatase family protein [Algoriphagus namhaensis]